MSINEDRISYDRIAKAQLHYRALGYENIETPWFVTVQAIDATLPVGNRPVYSPSGCLVGSGEQGFIQQMLDGTLKPGKYQTTTPCFRDERKYDELTRPYFMKVELIWYMPEDVRAAYETVMSNAMSCFFAISDIDTFTAMRTNEGIDITLSDIELGSYGVRQMDKHLWVFGTGLAEPRFSLAVKRTLAAVQIAEEPPVEAAAVEASAADQELTQTTLPPQGTEDPMEDLERPTKVLEFPARS